METKDSDLLEQQRQRRKRINRIKTGIVMTITIWMFASFIAIIFLVVQVIKINISLDQGAGNPQQTEQMSELSTGTEGTEGISDLYANVEFGIDSEENMAQEGDVHKVYLTFDSTPSENTNAILDVLSQYNVKATFFVCGNEQEELDAIYRRIAEEGHTMGMHSYSDQYSSLYASTGAFREDYDKLQAYLTEVTGEQSLFYRFPGGSGNGISNVNMVEFVRILNQEQITYFDWNVSAGDAANEYTTDDVVNNVLEGVKQYKTSVVLLHDQQNKSTTVEALGMLIEKLQESGAQILPIDEDTTIIQYIKADSVE